LGVVLNLVSNFPIYSIGGFLSGVYKQKEHMFLFLVKSTPGKFQYKFTTSTSYPKNSFPMPRPLLPPRGVFVPSELIYNPDLSSHPLRTWIQLRGLAWGKSETPQLSMSQLQELLSRSRSTIYGHMALLRSWGALRWRPSENGTLIISFPDSLPLESDTVSKSRKLEKPAPSKTYINIQKNNKTKGESTLPDSGPVEKRAPELSGSDISPVAVYRNLTKIKPNQIQRTEIMRHVTDIERWYRTVEHWLSHKWNPKNIPGMLDLYKRGGPDRCRVCKDGQGKSQLETLQEMRVETNYG
jgi:hypothetical protein